MIRPGDQFHLGIVVDDLPATLDELTRTLGYRWGTEVVADSPIRIGQDERTLHSRFVYSVSEPRLEIIQSVPGSDIWAASGQVHHLGYWSDDIEADTAALVGQGYRREVVGLNPGGGLLWSYLRNPQGLRVELIDRTIEPGLSRSWQG